MVSRSRGGLGAAAASALARQVTLRVKESNEAWSFEDLADGADVPGPLAIRGYSLVKKQQRELEFDQGTHLLEDP